MGLLTLGLGPGQRVVTLGLGQRVMQTAHPSTFNTPLPDPSNYQRDRMGTDGDVEYALWTPDPDCVYNGRALEIFLPESVELPRGSLDRIRAHLELLRPKTCAIRVVETRGPERLLIPSTGAPT